MAGFCFARNSAAAQYGGMKQLEAKPGVLARRGEIVAGLRRLLPARAVIAQAVELKPYETDALTAYRQVPLAVVLPSARRRLLKY